MGLMSNIGSGQVLNIRLRFGFGFQLSHRPFSKSVPKELNAARRNEFFLRGGIFWNFKDFSKVSPKGDQNSLKLKEDLEALQPSQTGVSQFIIINYYIY